MADDARISTALPRHPKTVKLQRRLGSPGCWSLICLFLWVADNRPDGDLKGMTVEDIEIAANWGGDNGAFAATLSEVRFIDGQAGSYTIHDWAEHNPWAAGRPSRIAAARGAANARWAKKHDSGTDVDAHRMQPACAPHETALPTSPHLTTLPDHTAPETNPPPCLREDFDSSSPRARNQNQNYTQADLDEQKQRLIDKDMRRMKEAQDKFDRKCQPGAHLPDWMRDEKEIFKWICREAGITVKRGLELEKLQQQWPGEQSLGASA